VITTINAELAELAETNRSEETWIEKMIPRALRAPRCMSWTVT